MTTEELYAFLRENLSIEITEGPGGFTDPNGRTVNLKLGDDVISTAYFNVRQTREYDG